MQATKLLVALLFLGAVGCGSDDAPSEAAAAEIVSEGHEDGDTDGHDLAVGGNTPTDAQGRYVLHHGDRGPDVLTLQERLVALGASLKEDDDFGDETLHAVLQFQRAERLTPDGVVGPATWAALDAPASTVVREDPDLPTGHDGLTPVGTFHVQSKSERAYAGVRGGVYMNFMTRFNGGIGFHSIPKTASGEDLPTPLGQRAVSHGCIRMADDQAQLVFENLPIGAVVEVHA